MGPTLTRRRFLGALDTCAAYLALVNTIGCEERPSAARLGSLRTPKAAPLHTPKVLPLLGLSPAPDEGLWAFHSRPDQSPAAVEVITQEPGTAPGHSFIALKVGTGEHGPMIIDDLGQLVWFGKYTSARDFKVQHYRGRRVLTWWERSVVHGHGVGAYMIFDDSYREITRVRAGNGYRGDLHEFLITPQDTALLTTYVRARICPPAVVEKMARCGTGSSRRWTSRAGRSSSSGAALSTSMSTSLTSSRPKIQSTSTTTSISTPFT